MSPETKAAIETVAIARAARLCDAAFATLGTGCKTFVKGKPVFVPFGAEKKDELRRLQDGAFESMPLDWDVSAHYAAESIADEASEVAFVNAAFAVYAAAGRAEVQCRFA